MRRCAILLTTACLILSCGGSPPSASHAPSPHVSTNPAASSSTNATPSAGPLSGFYGLLLSAGTLNLVKPDASVAASVPVATATTQFCSAQHDGVVAPPPVSASNDEVYFRDGDTKIRQVVPPGSAVDVTTVPGGPNVISFFSVSPDDQQIAVLVEDVSSSTAISERLYVEDLHGGGHHVDVYNTLTPKDKRGTTLWPMGWHAGAIVLAIFPACTFEPAGLTPTEWHVASATSATRIATIQASSCTLSYWPSAAGVACVDSTRLQATVYDWAGKTTSTISTKAADLQSGLSPSGRALFFATGVGVGAPSPATRIVPATGSVDAPGHSACLFINEDHLLAPDAVITFLPVAAAPMEQSGVCAGRFPGGL
jgi:hypothetical protein